MKDHSNELLYSQYLYPILFFIREREKKREEEREKKRETFFFVNQLTSWQGEIRDNIFE